MTKYKKFPILHEWMDLCQQYPEIPNPSLVTPRYIFFHMHNEEIYQQGMEFNKIYHYREKIGGDKEIHKIQNDYGK